MNRGLIVLVLAAGALALSACGSNRSGPAPTPTTVSTTASAVPATGKSEQDELIARRQQDEQQLRALHFKVVADSAGETAVGMPYAVLDLGCDGTPTRVFNVHHDNTVKQGVDYVFPAPLSGVNWNDSSAPHFTSQPTPDEIKQYGLCNKP